jgi:peptide/nickel transport system permease protein
MLARLRRWRSLHRVAAGLAHAAAVAAFVVLVTFLLARLVPGDPARAILGKNAPESAVVALRHQLGIDQAVGPQFVSYIKHLVQGDLGSSLVNSSESVVGIVGSTLPVTLAVVFGGLLLSAAVGIPAGLVAALSRRGSVDASVRGVCVVLLSTPTAFLGLLLLLVVGLGLGWLPTGGWSSGWPQDLPYVVLPAIALAASVMPFVARTVRQSALETAAETHVEAAIARGIPARRITRRHILPNSLMPVITLLGLNLGGLVTGAVIVEAIFDLPGLGSALVQAMDQRDYPVIQGIALITALIVVAGNTLADAVYVVLDPRTRRQ